LQLDIAETNVSVRHRRKGDYYRNILNGSGEAYAPVRLDPRGGFNWDLEFKVGGIHPGREIHPVTAVDLQNLSLPQHPCPSKFARIVLDLRIGHAALELPIELVERQPGYGPTLSCSRVPLRVY